MSGTRLTQALADRYRLERELGQGGMATVYLAHDVKHDRKVALKVLRPELAAVIGADRFLHEIKTTANLQHPHILALFDSGQVDGTVFYVMPFVEGESLRDRLMRERQLPIDDAIRIAHEVADALGYAHDRGIIHRDIKPENILLQGGHALVADFGIALAVAKTGGTRMTETGMSLGTPHYMSPEQAMGERTLDARTDVYALGCVLYEMLTGEPPFTGPTAQAIIAKVMTSAPEPVTTLRKTVPANVVAATMVALAKLPADRFASTAAFAVALANAQFTGGMSGAVAPTIVLLRDRRVLALLAGLAVLAAGVGAVITWLLRPSVPTPAMVARFEMPVPDSIVSPTFGGGAPVFPTRDGRLLWYTPNGLYERSLDGLSSRRVRELEGALHPIIHDESPDGTELLVHWTTAGGQVGRGGGVERRGVPTLNVVPLRGGPSRALADSADFAAWGSDGFIYFTYYWPPARKSGLARVPAQGGAVDTLATFSVSVATADVPQNLAVLPHARGLIVTLGTRRAPELAAFDLGNRTWHRLGEGGPSVTYVEPGYLIYTNGQSVN